MTEKDIIWLQFKFYEVISPKVLENVRINLNCVPAINIRHTEDYKRIKGQLTLYPLMGEDSFLDIDYIADNHKKRYDVKNYLSDDNISIVLRRGGVARFDERNALEHLQHLLSLIRE